MVMKRWIWGYLLSIFAVAFLNLILPALASQFGLKFLQYLSVFPVIGQKVIPLVDGPGGLGAPGPGDQLGPRGQFGPPGDDAPLFSFADPVPFFDWTLSPFWFTLLLQSGLIVTFASMAVRRWQKENKHSLSKPYALGILGVFIVLVTGNLWPAITGQYLPFAIFGINNLDALSEVIAIGLPLVYVITICFLCNFLFANVVPTHHDYVRGVRRAAKLNRKAALPWDDDSASIPFIAIALLGYWVVYSRMTEAGFMDFLDGTGFAHWRLPLGLGLVLCYSLLLFQVLQYRGVVLTALLLWLLPILVAIVSAAAIEDVTRFHAVVASLSPLATIVMTGMLPSGWVPAFDAQSEMAIMLTGVNTGLGLLTAQVVLLGFRWQRLRRTLS